MIKILVILIGSGGPAYVAWSVCAPHGVMVQFWASLISFSLGWFVSRRFVSEYLDL